MIDDHNDHDEWVDADGTPEEADFDADLPEDELPENMSLADYLPDDDLPNDELVPDGDLSETDFAAVEDDGLLSTEQFDDELARLEEQGVFDDEAVDSDDAESDDFYPVPDAPPAGADDEGGEDVEAFGDDERLRGPRAQAFRQRLRTQISVLPLSLYLLALGVFLLARELDVSNLPNLTTLALGELGILAGATTAVVHALLSGRRERGLLFLGLYVWVTALLVVLLIYGVDSQPDAVEWWPMAVWSLGLTLLVTYLTERTHDIRLVLLSTVTLAAGVVAYAVTSGRIDDQVLDNAADYWPLLLSVLGGVLLPLAFRRRRISRGWDR